MKVRVVIAAVPSSDLTVALRGGNVWAGSVRIPPLCSSSWYTVLYYAAIYSESSLGESMDDNEAREHPRGALLLILVYLLLSVFLWTHVYLRLWVKG